MAVETDDSSALSTSSLISALATLSVAQALVLDELRAISPVAAQRVTENLKRYVSHIEEQHGPQSYDARTTRATVEAITRSLLKEQV